MRKVSCSKMGLLLCVVMGCFLVVSRIARGDFTFGTATNLGSTVNSSYDEYEPSISADGLSLFFQSDRPGGIGSTDLYMATRERTSDAWQTITNLGPKVNSSYEESAPSISADGLELYFVSDRPGGSGNRDIYVTNRITTTHPWAEPVNLGPVINSSAQDNSPNISHDGLELFFSDHPFPPYRSGGRGGADIWVTTRASLDQPWEAPVNLGPEINSSTWECTPSISADGRVLFFQRWTTGVGNDDWDIYMARRATKNDPWAEVTNLGPGLNTPNKESNQQISADSRTLYFVSMRPGGSGANDIWQVPIVPVVDFNSDGIVDSADVCIMIDNWGTDEPFCDIGPMPWGDGVVDVEDLIVLAEHLFEEIPKPGR